MASQPTASSFARGRRDRSPGSRLKGVGCSGLVDNDHAVFDPEGMDGAEPIDPAPGGGLAVVDFDGDFACEDAARHSHGLTDLHSHVYQPSSWADIHLCTCLHAASRNGSIASGEHLGAWLRAPEASAPSPRGRGYRCICAGPRGSGRSRRKDRLSCGQGGRWGAIQDRWLRLTLVLHRRE